jgi:hypothetical protein
MDEGEQVVGFGVVGVSGDGFFQGNQCQLGEPAVVQHLASIKAGNGIVRLLIAGSSQPVARGVQPAAGLLGHSQLQHGGNILGELHQQGLELRGGLFMAPEHGVGSPQLPARLTVVRVPGDACLQLLDAVVVVAAVPIGDLEVGLSHLHLRVELEGAGELRNGLVNQTFLVVENAEIVVCPRVGGVNAPGE